MYFNRLCLYGILLKMQKLKSNKMHFNLYHIVVVILPDSMLYVSPDRWTLSLLECQINERNGMKVPNVNKNALCRGSALKNIQICVGEIYQCKYFLVHIYILHVNFQLLRARCLSSVESAGQRRDKALSLMLCAI